MKRAWTAYAAEAMVLIGVTGAVGAASGAVAAWPSGFAIWLAFLGGVIGGFCGAAAYLVAAATRAPVAGSHPAVRNTLPALVAGVAASLLAVGALEMLSSSDLWLAVILGATSSTLLFVQSARRARN